ncbi:unnamed protein product, partial [Anisakis simplex]|uniref:Uncharacterized protein n=1 Tax=Anisakis simplex TaxID=6269 RepID=A0A0M3JE13_ANISI
MTFHNVLKKTPATIQQFSLNDIDLTKVQTWTLALIAKFDALQQIALNSCRFPLNKESFICRLLAPSFHSLNAIAITDTDQISDKFVAIISKRCPMLSDIN